MHTAPGERGVCNVWLPPGKEGGGIGRGEDVIEDAIEDGASRVVRLTDF